MLALCIALLSVGFAAKGRGQQDEAAQVSGLTGKDLAEFRANMDEVRVYEDNPNIGLYCASRCSNSMAELLTRKDFTPAFLEAYSSFDPNPKTHPHFKDEGGLLATDWVLLLQNHPSLQSQSAGHEKEILSALYRKCREMQKVNVSYPKGQAPYQPMPFALGPAQRFAKKAFPRARILSVHTDRDVQLGVQELERLCGS